MHNFKKKFVSLMLGGVCALTMTATACNTDDTNDTKPAPEVHEHTAATEWVFNSTQHWHPASCDDTNQKFDAANHVDENGDSVCDVCGYNITPHTHVFDDEWSYDATGHWHAALCGHDVKSDEAAHTANSMGVCTECGYQVSQPDVSTVAKAIEVAVYNDSLAEHAEGTIDYFNSIYDRTSTYSVSYDRYEDYTYTYFYDNYSTSERWYTTGPNNDIMAVESIDGATPVYLNEEISADNLKGYVFTLGMPQQYAGITAMVEGLYNYAKESEIEVTENIEEGVYSFTYNWYHEGYSEQYDPATGGSKEVRDRYYDTYNVVEVSFTLDSQNYIDTLTANSTEYDSESLEFPADDENARGTLKADATPYIVYDYTLEQGGRNPYEYEEVIMTDFDLVDAADKVVNGDKDVAAITLAPYSYNQYKLANIQPSTSDGSIDKLSVKLYQYNEQAEEYVETTPGYTTMNVYGYAGYIQVQPQAEGTYRIEVTSARVTTYVNVIVKFPAPESIEATAEGTSADSYNTYTGIDVAIGGKVAYGFATGFTAELTGDNASDAEVVTDGNDGYTFTSEKAGSYTVKVTSTANTNVSDTITIVVANPPAIADVLNGNYVFTTERDMNWELNSNAYVGFVPASEGATNGTLKYYFDTYNGSLELGGEATYAYNSETGEIDVSGYTAAGEKESGLVSIKVTLENYLPTVEVAYRYSSYNDRYTTWTTTLNQMEVTEDEIPTIGGGEEPDPGPGEEITPEEAITGIVWADDPDWYMTQLYFNADGWGTLFTGSTPDDPHASALFFEWTISESGMGEGYYDITFSAYTGDDKADRNDYGDLNEFTPIAGLTAVYNSDDGTISFMGYTYTNIHEMDF